MYMLNPKNDEEIQARFRTFELGPLLSPGTTLTLDSETETLIAIRGGEVIEVQHFTAVEGVVAETLLSNYPEYCPYEVLLSALTGKSVDRCRTRILACIEETGRVDVIMKPIRDQLGRVRLKLVPFGLTCKSVYQTGYILITAPARTTPSEVQR